MCELGVEGQDGDVIRVDIQAQNEEDEATGDELRYGVWTVEEDLLPVNYTTTHEEYHLIPHKYHLIPSKYHMTHRKYHMTPYRNHPIRIRILCIVWYLGGIT